MMGFWSFQDRLTTTLRWWAVSSIAAGILLLRRQDEFSRGVGEQFIGWGAVNAAISGVGQRSSQKKRQNPDGQTPEAVVTERKKLSRLLWINTGLDVFYMLGGRLAVQTRGSVDERWRGRGWGIIIQGGFLFFFDLIHALLLRGVIEPADELNS